MYLNVNILLNAMKKQLLLLLIFFANLASAQHKPYMQFRDYHVLSNLDSLQQVLNSQFDKASNEYLNTLIELEMSRRYYSNDFGKDLDRIKKCALLNKNRNALAMCHFLFAAKLVFDDTEQSSKNALEALKFFTQQKDTSGIINCNFLLISLSNEYPSYYYERNNKKSYLFKEVFNYFEQTSNVCDKLIIITICLNYGHNFGLTVKEQLELYQKSLKLFKNNPQYNYLRSRIYYSLANVYYRTKDKHGNYKKKIQWCYLKSYETLASKNTRSAVSALSNLGGSFIYTREFKKSENYLKQAIALYKELKISTPYFAFMVYNQLSYIQYELKDYKNAYETRLIVEEVKNRINQNLKTKELEDLLTKYETEKRDAAIKNLELQNQISDVRSRQSYIVIILAFVIILIISLLLFRLSIVNKNLKKLTKSRDKLFTIISHDLRSPLSSYQRYAEIVSYLVRKKQFERLSTVLTQIDEIGLHLAAMLNNLLEWGIVQQKQIRLNVSTVNSSEFVSNLLPIYRHMASLKEIKIIEEIEECEISIDQHILGLIVRNLLDNAIKYSGIGGKILLNGFRQGDSFVLVFSNYCEGMTELQQTKIASLFNDDYDFEFGEDGLGVGLLLIKEFVKKKVANIRFTYDIDNYVIFKVVIPNAFPASRFN